MKSVMWNILALSFVLFASAQVSKRCPPPFAYPHISLDRKFAQKQTFSQGEKVYFNCAEDFTAVRGSRAVQCLESGEWTKLSLKCEKRSCGNAGELSNGQFVYEGESYIGERVKAVCDKGYTLKGLNYLTCKKSGWSGERPTCEVGETTCSAPVVTNSVRARDASIYRVGDNATFTCRQGFTLDGAQQVTCGPDGQWWPGAPRCLPSPDSTTKLADKSPVSGNKPTGGCEVPPAAPNSNAVLTDKYIVMTSFPSGTRVQYMCGAGYVAAGGSRYRMCRNGRWSGLNLKCERKLCGSAGEILNGHFTYTGVEFGDKATAVCDEGFTLVGKATRTCTSHGWDGRVSECEAAACPEPPQVANAVIMDLIEESYTYRTAVRYRCLVGTLIGEKSIVCGADGTWSGSPPTCQEITCPYPNVPNGVWRAPANDLYRYRETVQFECLSGFVIRGPKSVTCGSSGHWLPKLPECLPGYSGRYWRKPYNG
ncbi:complement receptor type 1-like isoform X2 [Betta splendens]|uniref:Complement receptor type 1-like isoform X2 n=1 Tax=Betta splendens TaxID=158456 RepID=A0A6P7N2I0_BETSP|nr:complement receptor type 1-like isoform X2 [Betta splendens]